MGAEWATPIVTIMRISPAKSRNVRGADDDHRQQPTPTHTDRNYSGCRGIACIPVMIQHGRMTSFKLVIGQFVLQITSSVFRCVGLVMPTGKTFAICGIWLCLRYLAVVRFVKWLVQILKESTNHNGYSRYTATAAVVPISVCGRTLLPMIIIAYFVFWGCIFGF